MSSVIGRSPRTALSAWLLLAGLAALAAPAAAQDTSRAKASPPAERPAGAPDAQKLALARDYMRESHMDAAVRGIVASMARSMPPGSEQGDSDVRARQFQNSFAAGMDAALPKIMDAAAEDTARTFSTQELKDMVAFFHSPSGQAMVAKTPALMHDVGPLAAQMLPSVYAVAEADFCRHTTCTQADHARFQRLAASLRAPTSSPPR